MSDALLKVEDLRIALAGDGVTHNAVENVSFEIGRGEAFGLVGESGCGKSITALAVMGLLRRPLSVGSGKIVLDGREIQKASPAEMRKLRGSRIGMIFQEPMTALNPLSPVGRQIAEMFVLHQGASWKEAMDRAEEALATGPCALARAAHQGLPAPAFGRHAAARDDRHRARLRARSADRRRAHDRARRHGAGRDHRPDGRALRRKGTAILIDQPRSRPGRQHVQAGGGDVRRPHRREPAGRRDLRGAQPPLHARPRELPPATRRGGRGAAARSCARSRVSCPRSRPIPLAAGSIRVRRGDRGLPRGGAWHLAATGEGPLEAFVRCHHHG